jgi:hypothetical protein
MPEMIAYCGLICQTCPIYLAARQMNTQEQARMRKEIVRLCREHYGMDIALEDVTDCDGCRTGGRLFSGCRKCGIRNCARAKGLENCAYCAKYACEQLEELFQRDATARMRLEQIRSRQTEVCNARSDTGTR